MQNIEIRQMTRKDIPAICKADHDERKKMKYQYKEMPESMKGTYGEFAKNFGFDWKEFIMGIPTPMFLVTTYKSNGQPNATMQSWAGATSANHGCGYYVILCSVNKRGHLYQSLNEKKAAVLNFMSSDLYKACMKTIQNNQLEADEITSSGLTVEKASWIEAPMVAECFMNLECKYLWEKEIVPGDARFGGGGGNTAIAANNSFVINGGVVYSSDYDNPFYCLDEVVYDSECS